MVPVVATFAMAEPLIIPIRADAITETFAGPPGERPTRVREMSLMNWEKPLYFRNDPNRIKMKTYVAETPLPVPRMPIVSQTSDLITRFSVKAAVPKVPGTKRPHSAK